MVRNEKFCDSAKHLNSKPKKSSGIKTQTCEYSFISVQRFFDVDCWKSSHVKKVYVWALYKIIILSVIHLLGIKSRQQVSEGLFNEKVEFIKTDVKLQISKFKQQFGVKTLFISVLIYFFPWSYWYLQIAQEFKFKLQLSSYIFLCII